MRLESLYVVDEPNEEDGFSLIDLDSIVGYQRETDNRFELIFNYQRDPITVVASKDELDRLFNREKI